MKTYPERPIQLNVNALTEGMIGNHGICADDIRALASGAAASNRAVQEKRGTGMLGWMDLPYDRANIHTDIQNAAAHVRGKFEAFVVLGIGGSALGPIAVQQALNHPYYNMLEEKRHGGPRFFVEDNIDPERMRALLDVIDIKKTCFNVITKSGETAETMSQYLIISDRLRLEVGDTWPEHIWATTDPKEGNLIKLAKENGFGLHCIPPSVGGRFSQLSPVGLFPAAVCGIDTHAMLKGARDMDARCLTDDVYQNPALMEAVLIYLLMTKKHIGIHVLMPYADSLKFVADWISQLLAESLGKRLSRAGEAIHTGQTPVKALGATDQHSQLQLYAEGPYDKMVTFLRAAQFREEMPIPHGCAAYPNVSFLGGKTLSALMDAELMGTAFSLTRHGRPNQTITLPHIDAHTIGQLLYFFQMTTAYLGELLNIDAYNQPGVQQSKLAAYAMLGNTGEAYKETAGELQRVPADDARYTL